MQATESAVVVLVPEAEPVVGALRAELDPAAARGVPAHVTVLYPFLPPGAIGAEELRRLGEAVSSVPRFEATFPRVSWFEEDFVWLAPEPVAAFRALTAAVTAAFPGHPPYGGAYGDDPLPHLTIGGAAPVERLRAAAAAVAALLPATTSVHACHPAAGP